ncbi:hypothetical protein JQK86_15150 [Clostridium beijerinckii]|uniref:hypothetical protein n=1 Tax=Clostridium TaxID=1485 RepID=UPI0015E16F71|nr:MULTISPECIES: hypothetical protein [Clostridium]MBN7575358.1 hypothetical protein [Clostridium beijerinckii]MBN7585122.1 hypothetical protein [Clostridium beijerinckii]
MEKYSYKETRLTFVRWILTDNLSSSINRLNTIISAKLGVAIDTDSSNDDSHNVA